MNVRRVNIRTDDGVVHQRLATKAGRYQTEMTRCGRSFRFWQSRFELTNDKLSCLLCMTSYDKLDIEGRDG